MPTTYPYPAVPAGRLLDDAAQDFPDAVAVEYRRYRLTYRKLADHADRLATALSGMGFGAGDRIALLLPNCPQLVVALFATWRIGASATMLTRQTAADLPAGDPRVVVTLDRWYATVAPVRSTPATHPVVVVTGRDDYLPFPRNVASSLRRRFARIPDAEGVLRFADLVRRSHPSPDGSSAPLDGPAVTSAGVTTSQRRMVTNSFQLRLWLPDIVAGDERVLLALPLSSLVGAVWVLTAVLSAATMILVDDSRAARRQRSATRAAPTILPLDADVARDLLRSSWRRGTLSSVRIAVATGALGDEVSGQLEQLTDKGSIRRAWGVRGMVTHADPIYGRVRRDTVGLPLPDTAVAIVDPSTGEPRDLGARGRLWLRGPQLDDDTWADTGLEGTLDADGYLVVHDDPTAGA